MPRELQATIHSNLLPTTGELNSYKSQITGLYTVSTAVDFDNHLIREFNRKCYYAGQTGFMIEPFDAGFRYEGTGNF